MKIIIVHFLFIVATTTASNLPSSFKICNRFDSQYSECLSNSITDAIVSMANGLKSFNVSPFEPLKINNITINTSESSLQQEYNDIQIHGMTKDLQINNVQLNWTTLTIEMDSYNPILTLFGDYKINGKITIIQINGSGKYNITVLDMEMHHSIQFEEFVQEDNEIYLGVTKYNIKLHPKKIIYEFNNLFNGDSILGKQVNKFMNENSLVVFEEFQIPLEKICSTMLKNTCNNIFMHLPKRIVFP
ncbi:protein takeout-like [Vespa mandarinia]|uniref:protein takeout-like n=1 Tax=Vespa mandarinia TaxID=7446 RepID=UPI00161206A6|nr:protein takeout-like [Vespa mandarinia]